MSMNKQLDALERLDRGESVKLISNVLGIGNSTLNDWRRNHKSNEDFCLEIESDEILSA